jgi:hypothetical protein
MHRLTLFAVLWIAGAAGHSSAQTCGEGFIVGSDAGYPGVGGDVDEALWWDPDGAGPEPEWLFVGGFFAGAGTLDTGHMAAWDGVEWRPMLGALKPRVQSMVVHADTLYASGYASSYLYQWRLGSGWSLLQNSPTESIRAMGSHGGALVVSSELAFYSGAVDAPFTARIASWDGTRWHPFPEPPVPIGWLTAIQSYDGVLYAGYFYAPSGAQREAGLLRFADGEWTIVDEIRGEVDDMTVANGRLYVAGLISSSTNPMIASIAAFDGTTWDDLGEGLADRVRGVDGYRDGVVAVGDFLETSSGTPANRVAAWYDGAWHDLGANPACADRPVAMFAAAVSGERIAVGGAVTSLGGVGCLGIGLRENQAWRPLSQGLSYEVLAMQHHQDRLFLGGRFRFPTGGSGSGVASWDGSRLAPVGEPLNGDVYDFTTHGHQLVAVGAFTRAGNVVVNRIARLEFGSWHAMGAGVIGTCRAVASVGGVLYAGGDLVRAGGLTVRAIARWDGTSWSPVGTGVNGTVHTIIPFGDGFVAGGDFTEAGGVPANRVAYWDGAAWHPLGAGFANTVFDLLVFDGALHAAGKLCSSGGAPTGQVARWNGATWTPVASPVGFGNCTTNTSAATVVYDLMDDNGVLIAATGPARGSYDAEYCGVILRLIDGRWETDPFWLQSSYPIDFVANLRCVERYGPELVVGGRFLARFWNFDVDPYAFWARRSETGAPWIAQQPVSATNGVDATVSVIPASGYDASGPLQIRWYRNDAPVSDGPAGASAGGGNVSGTTTATLTIQGVQPTDAGAYTVSIANACGAVASIAVTLDHVDPLCPADLNASGSVTVADLVILARHFGTESGALRTHGDCNGDGRIDTADFVILASSFGFACDTE